MKDVMDGLDEKLETYGYCVALAIGSIFLFLLCAAILALVIFRSVLS